MVFVSAKEGPSNYGPKEPIQSNTLTSTEI